MKKHLENILNDLQVLISSTEYNFSKNDIFNMQKTIIEFLELHDMKKIDLIKLKELSDKIYELNLNNSFSILTDHISNELYAFKFLLEENLK